MNSYAIGISGSWWLLVLFVLIAFSFAFYSYRYTVPPISSARKSILIGLRTTALALLLFILFEPIITIISGKKIAPKLALLLDNSQSMAQTDALGNRKEIYKKVLENLHLNELDDNQIKVISFDSEVHNKSDYSFDNLNFKGEMTNISKALKSVINYSEDDNIQAVLLISDGAFNSGNNPIYEGEILGKPIFCVGIGDSSEPKDISIQSIITNEIMYLDNPTPVNINIKTSGFENSEIELKLFDNDSLIGKQSFSINSGKQSFTAVFSFNPQKEGVHKLKSIVSKLKNEITYKNNIKSVYVDVLKNKRKITLFAGSPSSDVSFLTNALNSEKGIKIKSFVQKNNNEFYEGIPSDNDLQTTELFIFIGFPINSTPPALLHRIKKELANGKSIMFIASKFVNYSLLRIIEDYLPFNTTSSKPNEFLALPFFEQNAISNPILRVNGTNEDLKLWNKLPPVFKTETFVKAKPESEILATFKVNNVKLTEPLILIRSVQNRNSLAILGYGLYRWKLLGYALEKAQGRKDINDLYTIFIQNAVKWLTINARNKLVEIKTTKQHYTNTEKIEFFAQVYDKSFNPIDNASVAIKVKSSKSEPIEMILNSLGNGRYYGKIEGLPAGGYFYSGKAVYENLELGRDKGRFSVGKLAVEFQNLQMQSTELRMLSDRTAGKFYDNNNISTFIKDLYNTHTFKEKAITLHSEFLLWNLIWIMAIILLCFSTEWFLRKRSGMI